MPLQSNFFLIIILDDNEICTFSIPETLYESVIKKECVIDPEVYCEIPNDQSVTHLDNVSGIFKKLNFYFCSI